MTNPVQNQTSAASRAGRVMVVALGAWLALGLVGSGYGPDPHEAWTWLLFLISLVLPIWCCFHRGTAGGPSSVDVFQPGAVLAILFYVYTVLPAYHVWRDLGYHSDWTDPTWPPAPLFRFTLLVSLLSLVAFRIGYIGTRRRVRHHEAPVVTHAPTSAWPPAATVLAIAMVVIGLPFRLRHLQAFGGLTPNILLYLSPTYTMESGVTVGGVSQFFEAFLDWGALLLLYRAILTNGRKLPPLLIVGVALISAYLVSGKRSAILPFLLYPVIWHHYFKRRISVGRGVLYLGAGFMLTMILLFARSVGPLLASGGFNLGAVPSDVLLEPVRFYMNSPELAGFDMTMLAVRDRSPILHEIGGPFWGALAYNFVGALYIIPHVFWPGKPTVTDLGVVFYKRSVGGVADAGFTVGIVGGLYLFAGVIGIVVGMVIIGKLLRFVYEWLRPWDRDPFRVLIYGIGVWMTFHFLRFGELGGTIAFFYQFELVGVLAALLALRSPKIVRSVGAQ